MVFVFMERDNTGVSHKAATVTVDNGTVVWDGNENIKDWLYKQSFSSLGGKFDKSDRKHWDMLPVLISGHRLWVVKEAGKAFLVKGKALAVVTIDSEENDDWLKSLPQHANEIAIHERIAEQLKANNGNQAED